jgi:tyrosyl-DNA phosphodiesterase-1
VAIFTANFISIDWNNKTQGIWYQDFFISKLANPQIDLNDFDFEQDLIAYLSTLGKKVETFCNQLKKFDFSTAKVALIPSVPGVHKGNKMHRYGHLRVKKYERNFLCYKE